MDNNQVLPASDTPRKKEEANFSKGQKLIISLGIIILVVGIGIGAYALGKNSQNDAANISPTPVNELLPEESPTPFLSNTPTPSSTISGTLTPTPRKQATPKISPTPTITLKTKILTSTAALDGFESSDGSGNANIEIRIGRNSSFVSRGFVSFDLSDLPSGITIKEATLRLYQFKVNGSPYSLGEALKLDHLTYGDSLDNSDYSLPALSSSFITLTTSATKEWKEVNVLDSVKDDTANARTLSQFRIHFQNEVTAGGDTIGDFTYFESAENTLGTGYTPQLVIKYY